MAEREPVTPEDFDDLAGRIVALQALVNALILAHPDGAAMPATVRSAEQGVLAKFEAMAVSEAFLAAAREVLDGARPAAEAAAARSTQRR